MLNEYFPLLIFLAAVVIFGLIALFFPPWLAGSRPTAAKDLPYESGIVPRSSARRRFSITYYLTAMLFIIFDVEAIFILSLGRHPPQPELVRRGGDGGLRSCPARRPDLCLEEGGT